MLKGIEIDRIESLAYKKEVEYIYRYAYGLKIKEKERDIIKKECESNTGEIDR